MGLGGGQDLLLSCASAFCLPVTDPPDGRVCLAWSANVSFTLEVHMDLSIRSTHHWFALLSWTLLGFASVFGFILGRFSLLWRSLDFQVGSRRAESCLLTVLRFLHIS